MHDSLPKLTRNLNDAKHDLGEWGYCLIAEALSPRQVAALRARLAEQAAAEGEIERGAFDGGAGAPNQRVWNLINKGQVFRELILHPLVGEFMAHLLGPDFILSSLTANIAAPGGERMSLHRDQGYVPFHTPAPLVANIGWMLDEVTADNGGTRLVPRSHQSAEPLENPNDPGQAIAAEGPAGTALVFDGRTFHGTGPNTSRVKRHVLLSYFARFFMRQQENMFLSLDPELEASLPEELKIRLGYRVRGTLGGVQGPVEGKIVSRPHHTLGEMRPGVKHDAGVPRDARDSGESR